MDIGSIRLLVTYLLGVLLDSAFNNAHHGRIRRGIVGVAGEDFHRKEHALVLHGAALVGGSQGVDHLE